MTTFQMYLFTRLEAINTISGIFSILFGIATTFTTAMFFVTWAENSRLYEDEHKVITRMLKILCPLFIMNLFAYVATPTQKEMAAIIIVPKILSEENVDKIQRIGVGGVDIVKLATEYTKGVLVNKVERTEQ